MCTGTHSASEHYYGIKGYNKKKEKLCVYIFPQYTNCDSNCQVNLIHYLSRKKAKMPAHKKKVIKNLEL